MSKTLWVCDLLRRDVLADDLGEEAWAALTVHYRDVVERLTSSWEGHRVDDAEFDVFLFDEPLSALHCAFSYHHALTTLSIQHRTELKGRVSFHLGDFELLAARSQDAGVFRVAGSGRDLVVRLLEHAQGDQILAIRDLLRRAPILLEEAQIEWVEAGKLSIEGVPKPYDLVQAVEDLTLTQAPSRENTRISASHDSLPEAGARLGRYLLEEEIGRGGMGVVYRASDPQLGREIAIKMIPPTMLSSRSITRFRREARTLAALDHPGILPIHDFGEHQENLFLVMPLLQGETLRREIRKQQLVLGETLEVAIQIAEALDYSHERGVIHRDIKPENVMLLRERDELRVRVMDFGLAQESSRTRMTRSGGILGTLSYMSPEQVGGRRVDRRSDIYSLGMVLYESLAGEPAFSGTPETLVYRISHEHPQSLRTRGVKIGESLDFVVLSCLAKDPSERPQSANELARSLRRILEEMREDERACSVTLGPSSSSRIRPDRNPMMGRKQELAALQAELNRAVVGKCRLALIAGEAGSGKSRLIEEVDRLAAARGFRVLRGHFSDRRSAMPYQGFCELIQDYFFDFESQDSSLSAQHLSARQAFSDLAPDLLAVFPTLFEIGALRSHSKFKRPAEPHALQQAEPTYIYELLARTLVRIADGRPMVVLLENFHAGDVSLAALEYVVRRMRPTPTFFVGTWRPEEVERGHALNRLLESFEGDPRFARIDLGPLDSGELRQLIAHELKTDLVDEDVVERIHRATEGNPLFAHELIRSLVEGDDLNCDSSGFWRLRRKPGVTRDAMPETVQQAVKKRLHGLSEDQRRILGLAAILGRDFEYEGLEALAEAEKELDEIVDSLIERGILEEDHRSRDDRIFFSSAVLCDLLYNEVPRRKRRRLNEQHAEWLERRYAGHLERVYARLVHHFAAADHVEKTVRYALESARHALATSSPEEALMATRAALDLIDEGDVDVDSHGELLLLTARAERAAGRISEALFAGEQALDKFESSDAAASAALLLAEMEWQGRQGERARSWVEKGIELARAGGGRDSLRRLLILGGTLANLRGAYEIANRWLEEADGLQSSSAPSSVSEERGEPGGTLTAALCVGIDRIDPALLSTLEPAEISMTIYEVLAIGDEDGSLRPHLCEFWTVSDDACRFEFQLRTEVRFSDGSPLIAQDVKDSLERYFRLCKGPPILSSLYGVQEFLHGESATIEGLEIVSDHRIAFRLTDPLPILPALLSQPLVGIVKERSENGRTQLLGTGPFLLQEHGDAALKLRRNENFWGQDPPNIDAVEFRTGLEAAEVAAGMRTGEFDLGRDMTPEDLEDFFQDPHWRSRFVEKTRKDTYFVVINTSGPWTRHPAVRKALTGVVRVQDLIWGSLGRLAQPAVSLIPPGILGHDPGRRPPAMTPSQAKDLLKEHGIETPITLKAAIHPLFQDRYNSLTRALLQAWWRLGIKLDNRTSNMNSYMLRCFEEPEIDLVIGRWIGRYDDPDAFTYELFHSRDGHWRKRFSSARADDLLEKARLETRPGVRQVFYQDFENLLTEESVLLPLFHDIDYRLAGPQVRGLKLSGTSPYVNYTTLWKSSDVHSPSIQEEKNREIRIPLRTSIQSLDPLEGGRISEYAEVRSCLYDTLMKVDGARIVPWLAEAFEAREGGKEYFIRLRAKARFHDGRNVTARDVRFTLERFLQSRSSMQVILPIRGAEEIRSGERRDLQGIRLLSSRELVVELTRPLSYLPALFTHSSTSILPEGQIDFQGASTRGAIGSGPFRVVRFEPGVRLELDRNTSYWRSDLPRCDRLIFDLGVPPQESYDAFRRGRYSLVSNLRAEDLESLRKNSQAASYREAPGLATYFIALRSSGGVFADRGLRQDFARIFPFDMLSRGGVDARIKPAIGFLPPDFLGDEVSGFFRRVGEKASPRLKGRRIRLHLHSIYRDQFGRAWNELRRTMEKAGLVLETIVEDNPMKTVEAIDGREPDLVMTRWITEFPDPDGMVGTALHSEQGFFGKICGHPEIDRLIEEGRWEPDAVRRYMTYRQLEYFLAKEALIVPLFHPQIYRFRRQEVQGLRLGLSVPEVRYDLLSLKD